MVDRSDGDRPLQLGHHPGEELVAVGLVGDGVHREVEPRERGKEHGHLDQLDRHVLQAGHMVGRPTDPARHHLVLHRDDAEQQEEQEHRHREQQHLHQLGDDESGDEVAALVAGHLGLVHQVVCPPSGQVFTSEASGVPAQHASIRVRSSSAPTRSSSSGSRTTKNPSPITENSSTVSHRAPASMVAATCQTSALMNRNVTNTSSSGSARVTIGMICGRLDRVRASPR